MLAVGAPVEAGFRAPASNLAEQNQPGSIFENARLAAALGSHTSAVGVPQPRREPLRRLAKPKSAVKTRPTAVHGDPAALQERPPPWIENAASRGSGAPPASEPPSEATEEPASDPPPDPPSVLASGPASAPPTQTPALHERPEPEPPQSASLTQPHTPRSARQRGLSLVQSDISLAEHSVHSPARSPLFWHAGRAPLAHAKGALAPRSAAHGTQVLLARSHIGLCGSPQSASFVHSTQPPVARSQLGAPAPQRLRSVAVHCTQ